MVFVAFVVHKGNLIIPNTTCRILAFLQEIWQPLEAWQCDITGT